MKSTLLFLGLASVSSALAIAEPSANQSTFDLKQLHADMLLSFREI
jgi:hypothetical protein